MISSKEQQKFCDSTHTLLRPPLPPPAHVYYTAPQRSCPTIPMILPNRLHAYRMVVVLWIVNANMPPYVLQLKRQHHCQST
jgi:hypothetical protein